jgi:xanthine/CO dehydrogenase XdhC/CoxF family maturation factor
VRLKKEGRPCAIATIVQAVGSSPQKEGAKMLVRSDG